MASFSQASLECSNEEVIAEIAKETPIKTKAIPAIDFAAARFEAAFFLTAKVSRSNSVSALAIAIRYSFSPIAANLEV